MSTVAQFDIAVSSDGSSAAAGRAIPLAGRLVDASLAELQYLRELDAAFAPTAGRPFDRRSALMLREMYEQWSAEAAAVLERVRRTEQSEGQPIARAGELRDGHGRAMAMLSVTLEDIDRAREQFRRGEESSLEEVRRELRAAAVR